MKKHKVKELDILHSKESIYESHNDTIQWTHEQAAWGSLALRFRRESGQVSNHLRNVYVSYNCCLNVLIVQKQHICEVHCFCQ